MKTLILFFMLLYVLPAIICIACTYPEWKECRPDQHYLDQLIKYAIKNNSLSIIPLINIFYACYYIICSVIIAISDILVFILGSIKIK